MTIPKQAGTYRRTVHGVAALLLCLAGAVRADVWEGTLGKAPIVVKLDLTAAEPEGQYFYRKHRLGIDLSGTREADGRMVLEEWVMSADSDERPGWQLDASKGNTLNGEWIGDGKHLKIRLHRVSATRLPSSDDPGLAELRQNDPYEFLRLHGMPMEAGKVETIGDYRLQWWLEPRSGVELFRVVSGYPATQLKTINRALALRQWEQVRSYLDCTASPMSDYEPTTTLRYIGRDALSVSLFVSYYCGGAHPDFGDGPLNLDPRTGRELALEDLLWLGKGTPPKQGDGDDQPWFDYRSEVFAPWVRDRFLALYPTEMAGEGDDDCSYTEPEVWDFANWYITKEGLHLGATFARAARVCDDPDWSVLPWTEVRKHPGAVKIDP
jgi:hypothetical protein